MLVKYTYSECTTDDKVAEIIEMYDRGCSDAEIARFLKISLPTFIKYRKTEEFEELIQLGKTYSMAWWCKKGRDGISDKNFNFVTWVTVMKNRFGYAERPIEIKCGTHPDWKEGDVMHNIKLLDRMLAENEISDIVYASRMKALAMQAKILETIYIIPKIRRMELDHMLDRGEIDKKQHVLYMQEVEANSEAFVANKIKQFALSDGKGGDDLLLENGQVQATRRKRTNDNKKRRPKVYKV